MQYANAILAVFDLKHSVHVRRCYVLFLIGVFVRIQFAGLGTPIRRGLGGISMLKWSPTGDYFFAAKLYCLWLG